MKVKIYIIRTDIEPLYNFIKNDEECNVRIFHHKQDDDLINVLGGSIEVILDYEDYIRLQDHLNNDEPKNKYCNHLYSKALNQPRPRRCIHCGEPEMCLACKGEGEIHMCGKPSVQPISPDDIMGDMENIIPSFVIEAVNNLLRKKYRGEATTILQSDIVDEILLLAKPKITKQKIFDEKWMDFEEVFRKMGGV